MLRILVIDDRKTAREHVRELLETHLPKGADVEVSDSFPLDDVKAYASYIREHDIAALLLDERLGEVGDPSTGRKSTYLGHDVVGYLRARLPDFPVYAVTAFGADHDLTQQAADFEDIIDRNEFQNKVETYTSRILRAAARFQDAMSSHLQTLNALTLKAAEGKLSSEEQKKLGETRSVLGLPFTSDTELVASDLLARAREVAMEAEALINKLKSNTSKK